MAGIEDITMPGNKKGSVALVEEESIEEKLIIEEDIIQNLGDISIPIISSKILSQIEQVGIIEKNMSIVGRVDSWIILVTGSNKNRQYKKITIGCYAGYLSRKSGGKYTVNECKSKITENIIQIFYID